MNKKFVILIASILLFGTMRAQENYYNVTDIHAFQTHMLVVTQIYLDGVEQSSSDIEIGAFVGNEVRGSGRVGPHTSHNYNRAHINVYYTNTGENVQFRLYDHASSQEYLYYTASMECPTLQNGYGTNKYPVVLNFYTPFTKAITGYGTGTDKWYLISSPLSDATSASNVDNMLSNTYDLYRFNQSADLEWENWKAEDTHNHFDLESGKGYLYANSEDVTLTFTGEPYSGNGQIPLLKDNGAVFAGWNLIGNPFSSAAMLNMPFYRMNEGGSALSAQVEANNPVEAMEGVFVQATTNGQTATFTPTTGGSKGATTTSMLNISLNRNTTSIGTTTIDNAIVRFDGGQCLGKYTFRTGSTKVYFQQDGTKYAVFNAGDMGELPIHIEAEADGTFTLSFIYEGITFNYLHLIDNMTGVDINLLETSSYTFKARHTDYDSRFKLIFATGSSTSSETFGFINGMANFCIFGIEGEAIIQMMDMFGHVLCSEQFNGSYEKHLDVAPGVYMIRLIQGNDVKVQKILVK